jgi:hypothetical protein
MPRIFFGLPFSRLPRTTPPTSPAAAVATPVMTWALEVPFELELRALPPVLRDEELRLPDDELRLRDDADAERRLDALVLLGLLRELEDFVPEPLRLLLLEELRLLGLDPFELRELCFRFVCERVLAWAIAPP